MSKQEYLEHFEQAYQQIESELAELFGETLWLEISPNVSEKVQILFHAATVEQRFCRLHLH
ncbi:MAG: hypothetical protein R3A44_27235 [Caldilineaceae bacterium]